MEDKIPCNIIFSPPGMFVQSEDLQYIVVSGYKSKNTYSRILKLYNRFFEDDELEVVHVNALGRNNHHFYTKASFPSELLKEKKEKVKGYYSFKSEFLYRSPIEKAMVQLLSSLYEKTVVKDEFDFKQEVRQFIMLETLPSCFIGFFHVLCGKDLTEFGKTLKDCLLKVEKVFQDSDSLKSEVQIQMEFVKTLLTTDHYKTENLSRDNRMRRAIRKWYNYVRNSYYAWTQVESLLPDDLFDRLLEHGLVSKEDVTSIKSELVILKL